ncbi:hypothetical protein K445DRAFT_323663 [Daldinia sp. EC12]|nr:hypothetical protein K445DRAFT_323663 [Daldinia sp. EC12]
MRPVKITHFSQGRLTKDSLLLLKTGIIGIRYVAQLLARNGVDNGIQSKGGIKLPNEIWAMIMDFARKGAKDRFRLVKADCVASSPDTMLLRCYRHEFDCPDDLLLAGNLGYSSVVREFERYLACANPSTAKELTIKIPELRKLSGPENTFDVVLSTTVKTKYPCLYGFVDVPDFIARMEGGDCWVCEGEKFICPGCTGGKSDDFDAFMGCGVDLACPLCMGLEFAMYHKMYLETYYSDGPPEDEAQEQLKELEERLEELGYDDIEVPEHAWRS